MRERLIKLLRLGSERPPKFGSFDLSALDLPRDLFVHPDVATYFASCVPEEEVECFFLTLCSVNSLWTQNLEMMPCCYLSRYGFVGFGKLSNGDSIAFDVSSGAAYVFSHEIDYSGEANLDVSHPSAWRAWHPDAPRLAPMSRLVIIGSALEKFPSFDAFCDVWEQEILDAMHEEDSDT
jgi:hypothetical protein